MIEHPAEDFSGDWTIEVTASTGSLRFIVEGSVTSYGAHGVTPNMPPLAVSGPSWRLRFEAFSPTVRKGWHPIAVRRSGADCTLQDGLTVILQAHYLFNPQAGQDAHLFIGDCTLRCRNVEPRLNPWLPFKNPYDFRIPAHKPDPPFPIGGLPFPPRR